MHNVDITASIRFDSHNFPRHWYCIRFSTGTTHAKKLAGATVIHEAAGRHTVSACPGSDADCWELSVTLPRSLRPSKSRLGRDLPAAVRVGFPVQDVTNSRRISFRSLRLPALTERCRVADS
jgi:hypothetical protein